LTDFKKVYYSDPIYGTIAFDNPVIDSILLNIIDTIEFQRLRYITQLGFAHYVFPGATHNRYSHSLGVVYLTKRLLNILSAKEALPIHDNQDIIAVLSAALLHDIGHPPFSHAMESILNIKHEKLGREIIAKSPINKILESAGTDMPKKVNEILLGTYEKQWLCSLISSLLDMDRLDYLLRDSHYTGAKYGQIDVERILHSITIEKNKELGTILCASYKGYYAVEEYLLSRHYMYTQVYYHKTIRGVELLFKNIFGRAKELYAKDNTSIVVIHDAIVGILKGALTSVSLIQLDDSLILAQIKCWSQSKDEILKELSARFINRKLFKCFYDGKVLPEDKEIELLEKIKGIYGKDSVPFDYYYSEDTVPTMEIYKKIGKADQEEKTEKTDIFILDEDLCLIPFRGYRVEENIITKVADASFERKRRYCLDNLMKSKIKGII
jgi:HD superfamily phosphohydrolase